MRPALRKAIYRASMLLLLTGICKAGRATFGGMVPLALRKAGRAFLEAKSEKCDLLCAIWVTLSLWAARFQTLLML